MISFKDKNVLLIKVEGPKPKCTKVLLYNLEISIPRTVVEYSILNISIRFKSANQCDILSSMIKEYFTRNLLTHKLTNKKALKFKFSFRSFY